MLRLSYEPAQLSADHLSALERLRVEACTNILTMTTLAGCGHPGGSMSTLHALLLIYANANITADAPMHPERDRIIVSHGHISPGTYSTLAAYGFCDAEEACRTFRIFGSIFGGHVEQGVPGVEWNSGNLGQGLSAAVGSALGARLRVADPSKDLRDQEGFAWRTYCLMGDGEQQKGQIGEARRLAIKYGCSNVCAFIDMNGLQIGGRCDDIMPQQIVAGWASDGLGVACLGTAFTLHLASIGTVEEYNATAAAGRDRAKYDAFKDTLNARVVASEVFLVSGLLLAGGGAALLYFEYFAEEGLFAGGYVVPVLTPGGGAVTFEARF
jgi:transketolase N-terminal domain/subunit